MVTRNKLPHSNPDCTKWSYNNENWKEYTLLEYPLRFADWVVRRDEPYITDPDYPELSIYDEQEVSARLELLA